MREFYTEADFSAAQRRYRRRCICMAALLAPFAALYVWAVIAGRQGLMLLALLAAFFLAVFLGDLWLMPARRGCVFLREMRSGLRRSAECKIEWVETLVQVQDGIRVHAMVVRLLAGGDTRVYYVNAAQLNRLPGMGVKIRLHSYGRHAVGCETLEG